MEGYQLFIPGKANPGGPDPDSYGTDMRTIETAFNGLPNPTPSSGYESLTGPGETSPTGKLTQAGPLDVDGRLNALGQFVASDGGSDFSVTAEIVMESETSMTIESGTSMTVESTTTMLVESGDAMTIESGSGDDLTITSGHFLDISAPSEVDITAPAVGITASGTGFIVNGTTALRGSVAIGHLTTDLISFYGVFGSPQATHISNPSGGSTIDSGARAAIIAILSLLQGYGLMA